MGIDDLAIWNRTLTIAEVAALTAGGLSLEQLILGGSAGGFAITDITFDESTGSISITWDSKKGETYTIEASTDPTTGWGIGIDDGVEAAVGEEETTLLFNRSDIFEAETAPRVFFRVLLED